MIEDGAAKALLKMCKSPSRATQYSCALALGSLACETGYENDLIEMGVLAELMDKQKHVTEKKLVRQSTQPLWPVLCLTLLVLMST